MYNRKTVVVKEVKFNKHRGVMESKPKVIIHDHSRDVIEYKNDSFVSFASSDSFDIIN
jgi:hypothetical protein